jgi:AbrB family looped-hinge helix DNA binding protein
MPTATLSSKGQITIPSEIRTELGLEVGDQLEFMLERDGSVRMRLVTASAKELYGLLKRPGRRRVSVEEMNRGIADHAAGEDARIRSGS